MTEPLRFHSPSTALSDWLQTVTCPACGFHVAVNFYDGGKAPLTTLAWPQSTEQAQGMKKLALDFVRCVECGHVYNRSFRYEDVPYSDKPNLMYNQGKLWQAHLQETQQSILSRLPEAPVVVEIGAGNGHFLKALAKQRPQGRYIAYDPNGALDTEGGMIEFYAELFDPAVHLARYRPDLIIIRHMLEHLENPLGFVQTLGYAADWEGLNTALFVEVPCIDRVFETGRTVDFFYEHNSHFTTASLGRLLGRSHAQIVQIARGYEDEVVYAYAKLGHCEAGRLITENAKAFRTQALNLDQQMNAQLTALAESGKTVAVWGGTGKAATFINRYGVDKERFPIVVDSDSAKAGTYVPGTGQVIHTPNYLLKHPVDVIVIPTQWRARDIALEIVQRGITCTQLLLEYQGKLVNFHTDPHPYGKNDEPDQQIQTA
jgi:protein O-GlcNAc transferase